MSLNWSDLDWASIGQGAVEDLQQLLRIDTTNPPGRERAAAHFIAERLREDNLEPEIMESAPERANLVVRLEGSEDLAPLLISAHTDVVPAVGDWTHPPFGGVIDDGFLWGRGAIDMKNMVIMCLWTMKLLARMRDKLKRTIIFAAVADEETGSHMGSHWLVDNHPEKIRAGSMITEIGGFTYHMFGRTFYPIQVAEKGQVGIEMRARGQGGHGAIPNPNSAVIQLAEAVEKLGRKPLPLHLTPVQEDFLRHLEEHLPLGIKQAFSLLQTRFADHLIKVLPDGQAGPLRACLHNTATPTILRAGDKENVVPAEAYAILDGRTLPGQTGEDLVRELRQVLGNHLQFSLKDEQPPIEPDNYNTDLYQLMCDTLRRYEPSAIPVPQLLPGFTDAKAYSRLGMQCYGFTPLKLPKGISFTSLFHAADERIPVDGFKWGVQVFTDLVASYAGIKTH